MSIGLHHYRYAVLLVYLMHSGKSLLFAVGAIEEFPTLILSIYELWETRSAWLRAWPFSPCA